MKPFACLLYSFSYFQILFDKNEVPEHSLFNIKLEKRRQNGVHTLLLFDKNGVPQLSLFDDKLEKRSTHSIII